MLIKHKRWMKTPRKIRNEFLSIYLVFYIHVYVDVEHKIWVPRGYVDVDEGMVVLAMRCKLLQRVEIVTGKGMPVNEGQVFEQLENTSRE